MLQLEGIYHDEATDDEKAKEKALCAEEQRILMTHDSTLSGLTQETSYR